MKLSSGRFGDSGVAPDGQLDQPKPYTRGKSANSGQDGILRPEELIPVARDRPETRRLVLATQANL